MIIAKKRHRRTRYQRASNEPQITNHIRCKWRTPASFATGGALKLSPSSSMWRADRPMCSLRTGRVPCALGYAYYMHVPAHVASHAKTTMYVLARFACPCSIRADSAGTRNICIDDGSKCMTCAPITHMHRCSWVCLGLGL